MDAHKAEDQAPSAKDKATSNSNQEFQKDKIGPPATANPTFAQSAMDILKRVSYPSGSNIGLPSRHQDRSNVWTYMMFMEQSLEETSFAVCDDSIPPFPAKEANLFQTPYSKLDHLSPTILNRIVKSSPGDSEIIWNSSASYPSHEYAIPKDYSDLRRDSDVNHRGLLKGRKQEWGNLRLPCFHARIGKLLDRDYVWVMTQAMVSFENFALYSEKPLFYKVYPGYWGRIRRLGISEPNSLNFTAWLSNGIVP